MRKMRLERKAAVIPEAVMKRLPVYQRYLSEMLHQEYERISSQELAAKIGITASQLRQDLSYFGSFGQQGYGYHTGELLSQVNKILGLDRTKQVVLVGAGHLGQALLSYTNFTERGFIYKAAFDIQPAPGGRVAGIPVLPVAALSEYLAETPVEIGIITTPAGVAQEIATTLVRGGVKGIWNFAPVALNVPSTVVVEHVHISESLLVLSFKLEQERRWAGKNPE